MMSRRHLFFTRNLANHLFGWLNSGFGKEKSHDLCLILLHLYQLDTFFLLSPISKLANSGVKALVLQNLNIHINCQFCEISITDCYFLTFYFS